MILSGRNFLELGHPTLNNYLNSIERIGGCEQIAPYQARLEVLEEQVQALNTLRQEDVGVIIEIEVVQLRVDLIAYQEELRRQEETWSRELADLRKHFWRIWRRLTSK